METISAFVYAFRHHFRSGLSLGQVVPVSFILSWIARLSLISAGLNCAQFESGGKGTGGARTDLES